MITIKSLSDDLAAARSRIGKLEKDLAELKKALAALTKPAK
jgi:hypothetical protein